MHVTEIFFFWLLAANFYEFYIDNHKNDFLKMFEILCSWIDITLELDNIRLNNVNLRGMCVNAYLTIGEALWDSVHSL